MGKGTRAPTGRHRISGVRGCVWALEVITRLRGLLLWHMVTVGKWGDVDRNVHVDLLV